MESNRRNNRIELEFYLKLLPIVSVILIVSGYFTLSNYYNKYGIEIIHYLETTEIILSFLPILKATITPFLFMSILSFLVIPSESQKAKIDESNKNFKNKVKTFAKRLVLVILILSLMSIFHMFAYIENGRSAALGVFFISMWGLFLGNAIKTQKFFKKKSTSTYILTICSIIFIVTTYNMSIYFSNTEIKKDIKFEYFGAEKFNTDEVIYIGRTNNFIFLHDQISHTNFIYETKNVSNLSLFTEKRKFNFDMLFP